MSIESAHKIDSSIQFIEEQLNDSVGNLEKYPKYINIETVNTCNARCIMCGIDFDKRKNIKMDDALFDKIINEIELNSEYVERINLFFDNEPLMDKSLPEKIKRLKNSGIKNVMIASNGSIISETAARKLVESGLDEIYLSIDSLKPEVYEKIRVGLSFERVYKNIRGLIKVRNDYNSSLKIRLQMVLQEENKSESKEFIEHWKQHLRKDDVVVVFRAHNWGGVVDVEGFDGDENLNKIPCTILWSNIMIHSDGSVALCSVDTEQDSQYTLGNINESSIKEVWNGAVLNEYRKNHLLWRKDKYKLCDGCTTWREDPKEEYIKL